MARETEVAFAFFTFMGQILSKLASAIRNDIISGLRGYHHNLSLSTEQLEDDIVDMRLQVIKEYSLRGLVPLHDLLLAINCIDVDCKDLDRCSLCKNNADCPKPIAHFEIPQLMMDYGIVPISYIGTTDRMNPFIYYTSPYAFNYYRKYRKRGKNKPFVFIDVAPNENGMLDCFLFNAPLLKQVSVVGVFKDPRQLEQYSCCQELSDDNFTFLNTEVKKRVTEQKIRYYRQLATPILPNNQTYAAG